MSAGIMKWDWAHKDAISYGIVAISVANMRQLPVFPSELVDQVLLGTVVPVFEEQNGFYYMLNRDGHWGWLSKPSLQITDATGAAAWEAGERAICMANYGVIRSAPRDAAPAISDLVACAVLKNIAANGQYCQVELPDGRNGFLEKSLVRNESTLGDSTITAEAIFRTTWQFLGIPYLWGGTSSKGFDCSGFVQTVFRLLNLDLPRNSRQMAEVGETISFDDNLTGLKTGDLLFFGNTLRRITHVAIYLGDGQFIHADGTVHIDSLQPGAEGYNEYRHQTLLKAQRIF